MIEHKGKKFYTTYEITVLINDPNTEIHKVWESEYPNYQNVILLEQVNRLLYEGKKNKKVEYIEFTKTEKSERKYFAFNIESVIEYLKKRETLKKFYNIKVIEKE